MCNWSKANTTWKTLYQAKYRLVQSDYQLIGPCSGLCFDWKSLNALAPARRHIWKFYATFGIAINPEQGWLSDSTKAWRYNCFLAESYRSLPFTAFLGFKSIYVCFTQKKKKEYLGPAPVLHSLQPAFPPLKEKLKSIHTGHGVCALALPPHPVKENKLLICVPGCHSSGQGQCGVCGVPWVRIIIKQKINIR